jgi:hypothetical protein
VANTTFKAHEVASSTAFFSSGMMIMAAFMPIVGLLATSVSYTVSFWVFAVIVLAAFVALLAYIGTHGLLSAPQPAGAPRAGVTSAVGAGMPAPPGAPAASTEPTVTPAQPAAIPLEGARSDPPENPTKGGTD